MYKSIRQAQKEQTRNHLIAVAITQLAQGGLLTTPTATIAAVAGVSHGTIFAHFPTRDALLNAVLEAFAAQVTQRLHQLVQSGSSVQTILEAHLQSLSEFEPFYTRLVIEGRLLPESARNNLIMIQSAIAFHLIQAAERESAAGTIRPIAPHLFFNTWIGLLHHYLANSDLFAPGESVLDRYGATLVQHFLALIKV
jgi:AcrR family transcriptional regulator